MIITARQACSFRIKKATQTRLTARNPLIQHPFPDLREISVMAFEPSPFRAHGGEFCDVVDLHLPYLWLLQQASFLDVANPRLIVQIGGRVLCISCEGPRPSWR